MAITNKCFDFLKSNQELIKWKQVLMIWRQSNYLSEKYKKHFFDNITTDNYSEFIWNYFKVKSIESIDFSNYESPTFIHDMNKSIDTNFHNKYDLIYDWGSTEHVYNIPTAFANYMNTLKVWGHYIWVLPWNNLCNHGFYQFSPDFFYSLFSKENWFKTKVYVTIKNQWFLIKDLRDFDYPIHFNLNLWKEEALLYIVSEKIKNIDIKNHIPYQTIYNSFLWDNNDTKNQKKFQDSKIFLILNTITPKYIKNKIWNYNNNKLILQKTHKPKFNNG